MPITAPVRVGTVALLDSIHVLTDWTAIGIRSLGSIEMAQYVSHVATIVLAIATWVILPHVFNGLNSVFVRLNRTHSSINHIFLTAILIALRWLNKTVETLEIRVEKAVNQS